MVVVVVVVVVEVVVVVVVVVLVLVLVVVVVVVEEEEEEEEEEEDIMCHTCAEAWMPGRKSYGEISSASSCGDYQVTPPRIPPIHTHAPAQRVVRRAVCYSPFAAVVIILIFSIIY